MQPPTDHLSEDDRALLAEVLGGERRDTDPAVQRRLREHPPLASELAALREVAGRFAAEFGEQRAEIAQAHGEVSAHDVARARAAVADWRERQLVAVPRRRAVWWSLVAALVLAALVLAWQLRAPVRPNEALGGGGVPIEAVRDDDGRLLRLRWPSAKVPPNGSFTLEVAPAVGGQSSGATFLTVSDIEDNSCPFDSTRRDAIERQAGARLFVRLREVDALGKERIVGWTVLPVRSP